MKKAQPKSVVHVAKVALVVDSQEIVIPVVEEIVVVVAEIASSALEMVAVVVVAEAVISAIEAQDVILEMETPVPLLMERELSVQEEAMSLLGIVQADILKKEDVPIAAPLKVDPLAVVVAAVALEREEAEVGALSVVAARDLSERRDLLEREASAVSVLSASVLSASVLSVIVVRDLPVRDLLESVVRDLTEIETAIPSGNVVPLVESLAVAEAVEASVVAVAALGSLAVAVPVALAAEGEVLLLDASVQSQMTLNSF
jgi:hypothetical protein